jgi:hypothetical protein
MLYINLSDELITVIQTKRSIIGNESIIASAKKSIAPGIIEQGIIKNQESFVKELYSTLQTAYPKAIKDNELSFVLSDNLMFLTRFSLNYDKNSNISSDVISYVKNSLNIDPEDLENFYRQLTTNEKDTNILYTAMQKKIIMNFLELSEFINFKCKFLSCQSFCVYELLKENISSYPYTLLYNLGKFKITYTIFDKYGPLEVVSKKLNSSNYNEEILVIWEKNAKINVDNTQIIISGEGAKEIIIDELESKINKQVKLLETILLGILNEKKIIFDTGGITKDSFCQSLGLMFQVKNPVSINYIKDINYKKIYKNNEIISPIKEEDPVLNSGEKKTSKVNDDLTEKTHNKENISNDNDNKVLLGSSIEEYKKKGILQLITNKIFIIILTILIISGVIFVAQKKITVKDLGKLPFITKPTLIPTNTPIPTVIPTPTIDIKLKRSDLKISLQNGTDKSGLARDTADTMEKLGFKGISISNADKTDYENTIIRIKESKKNYLQLIISSLSDKFDTKTIEDLDKDNRFDAIIILGKK